MNMEDPPAKHRAPCCGDSEERKRDWVMLAAGIPLVQAFEIVGAGHENPAMQKLILQIKADVEGGSNLAEALARPSALHLGRVVDVADRLRPQAPALHGARR